MKTLVGKTTFWIASTLATPLLWGQNNNDATLNNGGDVIFSYSDPALGGDLYWRAHTGANMMNDTSGPLGAPVQTMEVDGYFESIFDTDWTTTPIFYDREHVPVVGGLPVLGGGTLVVIGPSGLGPPAAGCPPVGFVDGYIVDIAFGATPGSGVVLPADGTPGSDTATVWHVGAAGCIVTTPLCPPGACGAGDYTLQDVHSTNETQADIGGTGLNPSGGFQIAGGGLGLEAVTSMAEGNETWRGNLVQVVAASSGGAGVEVALNGGGAMNGRALPVSAGGATLGIEIRDSAATGGPNIAIAGASLTKIPGPGAFVGAWLKVIPDGLFNSTSALWTGSVAAIVFALGPEGAYTSPQLPVPPTAAGATLNIQGATFDLGSFIVDNTNVVTTALF